jgi:hypothetical protein
VSSDKPREDGTTAEIQFWRSGEWTGVYLNGTLVRYGDHYLADEWLQERHGVKVIDSDAWVPDGRSPLRTMAEVVAEEDRRAALRIRAEGLRRQANDLAAEAERLEAEAKTAKS